MALIADGDGVTSNAQTLADILAARYPTPAPAPVVRAPLPPKPTYIAPAPTVTAQTASPSFVRRPVEPVAAPAQTASPSFVRRPVEPPPTPTENIWERTVGALSRGLDVIHPMGERATADELKQFEYEQWQKKPEPSQHIGRQYYQGGSEQAYLGPVKQAEEYFFGTGDRWGLGSSYIDIAPEDRRPPPILNQSTVRILTKSGPSYLEGVDYGPKMTMEDIERIYEYDPVTGHYLLKGAEPVADYGYPSSDYYTSSGQGYASAGPSYGTDYGYGSRGGQVGGGLVNWRIG